jgi:four helix bundle protein
MAADNEQLTISNEQMYNMEKKIKYSSNPILDKSFSFSVRIVELNKYLKSEKNEFTLSKQILRCGTSVGANVEEAIGGISKKDFRAKMSIAYKEIRETKYWLRLLKATDFINDSLFNSLFDDADELAKMLYRIIENSKS